MASKTRQQLEGWLKTIRINADVVFDVGGLQNPVRGRTAEWEVREYKILDLENPHEKTDKVPDYFVDIEKHFNLDQHMDLFDRADAVFCLEVFEYLINPLFALSNINKLLKKGGRLYLSTHFVYKTHPPIKKDFLRYTPWGIEELLKRADFIIENHVYRYAESDHLQKFYESDKMRGKTNIPDNVIGSLIEAKKM